MKSYVQALLQGRVDGKGVSRLEPFCNHHRILSEALSHAIKMGLLVHNVAKAVDPPRPKHKDLVTLAPEAVPEFLKATQGTAYYALYYTALFTGMYLGELLEFRWSDVGLSMALLSVVQALYKR